MLLGQNFRFGYYSYSPEERIAAIKKAGFDSVMFWWGNEFDSCDGTKEYRYELAVKAGLQVSTVHFPSTNAHFLWLNSDEGTGYVREMVSAVHDCGRLHIKNLVMHTTRKFLTVPPNQTGLEHLQKVLTEAESEGVKIAIENTRFLNYNSYIYENLSSPALGFCFDTGHANCYTPGQYPLDLFSKYLSTTHIHDNYGPEGHPSGTPDPVQKTDLHNLIGDGNIDFVPIFKKLKELQVPEYNLESYCFPYSKYYSLSMDEFLEKSFCKLKKLYKS